MAVGVLTVVVLVRARRWPEACYVTLSLWALGTSYWYMSVPRATLLWWPLWIGIASSTAAQTAAVDGLALRVGAALRRPRGRLLLRTVGGLTGGAAPAASGAPVPPPRPVRPGTGAPAGRAPQVVAPRGQRDAGGERVRASSAYPTGSPARPGKAASCA